MKDILTVSEHQEIKVSKKRNLETKTISYEDRELLFDIVHKDRDNKNRYVVSNKGRNTLKVNSIVGSISLKTGLTIEILPKFAKNNLDDESIKKHRKMLINILRVSKEKNFISSNSQNSKVLADEMPLLHYVIELFSEELLSALRGGVYSSYNKKVENSSHIRGTILVSKTIQNNIIDKSKVYISYNQHSSNNLLMQVFRTLAKILLNDNNLSYKAKQNLHEVYLLLDNVEIIKIQKYDFKKITFNRLNDKFETLFTQAEFIFNQYMPFSSSINSTPFWSILFDMNYLFEKFCAYLFRKSNIEIEEQSIINCFTDNHKMVSSKPDFIIQNDTETINVLDAKWKILDKEKSLYGLNAQNFWQLFSYMNLINHDKEIKGYFIVPKFGDCFEDDITFTPIKDGNKSINILSIDFSLDFEELVSMYSFEMIDNELKLCEKAITEEPIIKAVLTPKEKVEQKIENNEVSNINVEVKTGFNLKSFIDELQLLHKTKSLRKKIPNLNDKRFENLFKYKVKNNINKIDFKIIIKENIKISDWNFNELNLTNIEKNIILLKATTKLILSNNKFLVFPASILSLINLQYLDLSNNNIINIPNEIENLDKLLILDIRGNNNINISNTLKLKSLKLVFIDKTSIASNLQTFQELRNNDVIVASERIADLSKYIDILTKKSILKVEERIIDHNSLINDTREFSTMELTLENYDNFNDEQKKDFCIDADFTLVDNMVIKKLCYRGTQDILIEILFNDTIPLRFIVLIYILNYRNEDFKKSYIFEKINELNHEQLKYLISLAEENTYFTSKYIEDNFQEIDEEILFGYAMSNTEAIMLTRLMIARKTDNLFILNELSRNERDEKILKEIIFKSTNSERVKDNVSKKDTIYSIETLNRISRYKSIYKKDDQKCLIYLLAKNYNLSNETQEYLFDTYKNDKALLEALNKSLSYSDNTELKTKVAEILGQSFYSDSKNIIFNQMIFK